MTGRLDSNSNPGSFPIWHLPGTQWRSYHSATALSSLPKFSYVFLSLPLLFAQKGNPFSRGFGLKLFGLV